MKVLHSKTASEPILLVSACPTMNLFAIVTQRAVVVYRSTTLTALVSIALAEVDVKPAVARTATTAAAEADLLHACWTPTGSLFTLALASGVVLLIDVESGELVRRLLPTRDVCATGPSPTTTHSRHDDPHSPSAVATTAALLDLTLLTAAQDGSHSPTAKDEEGHQSAEDCDDDDDGDGEAQGVLAHHRRCRRPLWRAPAVPLSTTVGEPVCALAWVRVPISQDLSVADGGYAQSSTTTTAASSAYCAPLLNSLSAPLLAELGGIYAMRKTSMGDMESAAGGADTVDAAVAVHTSVLVVLDSTGVMSLVQGGLYEVGRLHVQLPEALHPREGTMAVRRFALVEGKYLDAEVGTATTVVESESVSFEDLTRHWLASRLGPAAGPAASCATGANSADHLTHHGVLQLVPRQRGGKESDHAGRARDQLLVLPLRRHLCRVVEGGATAALCFIAECARLAETCRRTAVARWCYTLRTHTRQPLQLPQKAALLHDALVEEVAQPDSAALVAYYQSLPRQRLSRAGELLTFTLASIGTDMLRVVQPCCQAALQVAQQQQQPFVSSSQQGAWHELVVALAEQQRACEVWMDRVKTEAQMESQLVQWVLQRAALTLALEGLDEDVADAAGTTSAVPLPLPVARHPALLRALGCIQDGKSTAWCTLTPQVGGLPVNAHAVGHDEVNGEAAHQGVSSSSSLSSPHARTRSRGDMASGPSHDAYVPPARASEQTPYRSVEALIRQLWTSGAADVVEGCANHAQLIAPVAVVLEETPTITDATASLWVDFLPADKDAVEDSDEDAGSNEERSEGDGASPSPTAPVWLHAFSIEATDEGGDANSSPVLYTSALHPSAPLAACTRRVPVFLQEACAATEGATPASLGVLSGFISLDTSRHVLIFSEEAKGSASATRTGSVTAVIVQSDGHVELTEMDDDDDDDDDEKASDDTSPEEAEQEECAQGAERPAVLTIPGIKAPLRVAVSRSRQFGVVAAHDKFVVLDLYRE